LVLLSADYAAGQNTQPPLTLPALPNQLYLGYERSQTDYALKTPTGDVTSVTSGLNLQYGYRKVDHVLLLGTLRYGSGKVLGEHLTTLGAGAGYVLYLDRYEPFAQALVGLSRLSSKDHMYLASAPHTGFATLAGAGLDVALWGRWGVRPIYIENQYLPFGIAGKNSVYWNIGGGVLFYPGHRDRHDQRR
jgi:hypothetical protein